MTDIVPLMLTGVNLAVGLVLWWGLRDLARREEELHWREMKQRNLIEKIESWELEGRTRIKARWN